MTNKEIASSFLQMIIDGKIQAAYEKHVAPDCRHHNPYHPGDRNSLMTGMEEADKQFPEKAFRMHRSLQDGDLVAVHSHLTLNRELDLAVVHLMRFREGKIVEFWDIAQQVPKESPNKNGMF